MSVFSPCDHTTVLLFYTAVLYSELTLRGQQVHVQMTLTTAVVNLLTLIYWSIPITDVLDSVSTLYTPSGIYLIVMDNLLRTVT